ncbi:MAG: hypothetical protein ABI612_10820 [Betaproteobacteria bacterium]
MSDTAEEIAKDIPTVASIEAVPALLRVLCETSSNWLRTSSPMR